MKIKSVAKNIACGSVVAVFWALLAALMLSGEW